MIRPFLLLVPLLVSLHFSIPLAFGEDMSQMDRIKKAFNEVRADNLHILDGFYAPDTQFVDPLGVHQGLEAVKKYYANLYTNVTEIHFDFLDTYSDGNRHVLVWKMFLRAKGLNNGEVMTLDGTSIIRFDERNLVVYHRDYFDMGEFIYEKVPVLRWIIGKVKQRLKP